MKNLQIRNLDDLVYFKALEWRAKLRCDTWNCLLAKIFSRDDVLEQLRKSEASDEHLAGIAWALDIDEKLDAREREIVKSGDDILV